jgi:hypothetical protein
MVLSKSCHETKNVGFMLVMLASEIKWTPTSLHLQHSPSVWFSSIPRLFLFAKTSALHGSPLPSHSDESVVNCSGGAMANDPFWRSLRPNLLITDETICPTLFIGPAVCKRDNPTTMGVEADDVNTCMQYAVA